MAQMAPQRHNFRSLAAVSPSDEEFASTVPSFERQSCIVRHRDGGITHPRERAMGDLAGISPSRAACAAHLPRLVVLALVSAVAANAAAADVAQKRDVAACQALDATIRSATKLSPCRAANGDVAIGAGNC